MMMTKDDDNEPMADQNNLDVARPYYISDNSREERRTSIEAELARKRKILHTGCSKYFVIFLWSMWQREIYSY